MHNPELYARIHDLYVTGRVEYAITDVGNTDFYAQVASENPGARSWTLSVTNIFDMPYASQTFKTFQLFLKQLLTTAGISSARTLTVFRTSNSKEPH